MTSDIIDMGRLSFTGFPEDRGEELFVEIDDERSNSSTSISLAEAEKLRHWLGEFIKINQERK